MPLMAKDTGGSDFTPVPAGTHLAICNMVVDLGLQETQGPFASVKHQAFLRWELPHERIDWTDKEGQKHSGPMSIGKTYTLSLSEKANLRKDLEVWRGKAFTAEELAGFDLFKLLGVGCQVTVVHEERGGKTYANVKGMAGWPKGVPKPQATENSCLKYSPDEPADFEKLPQWLKDKLNKQVVPGDASQPAKGDPGPAPDDGSYDPDDEIPF